MCHFGLSLPISLKPVGVIPSHLDHKPLGKKVCYCRSLPSIFFILLVLGLAIVFIDEYNPSKIFKMASNSFGAMTNWQRSLLICHPFDCCKRGYVVLGLSNSSSLVVVCPSFPLTTSTLCGYRSDFNGRLEFSLSLCGPGHAVGLLYVHHSGVPSDRWIRGGGGVSGFSLTANLFFTPRTKQSIYPLVDIYDFNMWWEQPFFCTTCGTT